MTGTARVGVVTTIGCPHCKRAKAALKERGIEYTEAQLAGARDVLAAVKDATGQRTVPQIFIGGDFIGGASDLLSLLESDAFDQRLSDAKGKPAFPENISKLLKGTLDTEKEDSSNPALDSLAAELKSSGISTEQQVGSRTVTTFTAKKLSEFLSSKCEDPAKMGPELLTARAVLPVTADAAAGPAPAFDASSEQLYALPDDALAAGVAKGDPLNAHCTWYGEARSAVDVSADLRARILNLYDAHLSADGKAVDYDAMKDDAEFKAYVQTTAELQRVDIQTLSREEKIAFFVNVYNALIVHGTVALGTPSNILKRLSFFGDCKYLIGGLVFSANDIEHGVLRSNAISPAAPGALLGLPGNFLKPRQFKEGDARRKLVVDPLDPRIHFALVCGAKSCPPIKLYTPDNLDEGLQDAASAFCDGEIEVDLEKSRVTMSKIFKWYANDFDPDVHARLRKLAAFCSGEKKEALLKLADSPKKPCLKYNHYDWTPNAK